MTLNIYGHLFKKDDGAAADAIEAALRYGREGVIGLSRGDPVAVPALFDRIKMLNADLLDGWVAEWFKAPVLKAGKNHLHPSLGNP